MTLILPAAILVKVTPNRATVGSASTVTKRRRRNIQGLDSGRSSRWSLVCQGVQQGVQQERLRTLRGLRSSLFECFSGTMPRCDSSETNTRDVGPKPSHAVLQPNLTAGISGISWFSCMASVECVVWCQSCRASLSVLRLKLRDWAMEEQNHNPIQPPEQVALRSLKVRALFALIIASILPAFLIAYWLGFISGKAALLASLLIVILLRVFIGKPTFYSARANT